MYIYCNLCHINDIRVQSRPSVSQKTSRTEKENKRRLVVSVTVAGIPPIPEWKYHCETYHYIPVYH